MTRIRKSNFLPWLLLLVGIAFYVYFGIEYNAWKENLMNMLIYFIIILALYWSLRKKEQLEDERKNS